MQKFVLNLQGETTTSEIGFGGYAQPKKRSRLAKGFAVVGILFAIMSAGGAVSGYFYWQSLKERPQYSLALIVDAARRDDQASIDAMVDTNALVDDFMPQITDKAIELYGRGLPPEAIARVGRIAEPVMPAVKDRARAELPRLIRQKTEKFEHVPFFGMVFGAERYLDIRSEGDTAFIKSKLPEHSFEVTMRRVGDRWNIVGVRDEKLATNIARAVGQEIIAIASNGGRNAKDGRLGIKNVTELLKQAEDIFK